MNFISGVAQGVVAEHVSDAAKHGNGRANPIDLLEEQNRLLHDILKTLSSSEHPADNHVANLMPDGQNAYSVRDSGYNHLSLFCATPFTILIRVPGLPAYSNNLKKGWSQLDLDPGVTMNSGDASTYPVIVSYRDDAIGVAI